MYAPQHRHRQLRQYRQQPLHGTDGLQLPLVHQPKRQHHKHLQQHPCALRQLGHLLLPLVRHRQSRLRVRYERLRRCTLPSGPVRHRPKPGRMPLHAATHRPQHHIVRRSQPSRYRRALREPAVAAAFRRHLHLGQPDAHYHRHRHRECHPGGGHCQQPLP